MKPAINLTPLHLLLSGYLTVGSYTEYPPQEYIDPATHAATGFDIELIQTIAANMGLKVKVVSMEFRNLVHSLAAKRVDLVISAVSITPALRGKMNFVPYFNGGESLMVLKGNPGGFMSVSDLCGQRAAARSGTIEVSDLRIASDDCQEMGKQPITIVTNDSQDAVIQLLLTKQVVVTYLDSPVTDHAVQQYSGSVEAVTPVVNANLEGIALRMEDVPLFDAVQSTFDHLKGDGSYHNLIVKWGLTNEEI